MRNSQSDNRQLSSIAARDDELRAPVQTMQMYDINSQDRPVDATDQQRNCLVAATATATGSMMTAGQGQSFVRGLRPLRGGEEGNANEKQRRGRRCVCDRATGPFYFYVVSIGLPVCLAVERKPSKYDPKKKPITSLMNRKLECDLKCVSILSKTEWLADVC